jgi:hypothetical protein
MLIENKIYHGLKAFDIVHDNKGIALRGGYGTIWRELELQATCSGSLSECRKHLLGGACTCGIYSVYAGTIREYPSIVYASVIGWGAIFEGAKGFRSEHVKIDKLWVNTYCVICEDVLIKCKLKPVAWNLYSSKKEYQNSVCVDHVKNYILNTTRRNSIFGYRPNILIDELTERYPVEVELGNPWSKKEIKVS